MEHEVNVPFSVGSVRAALAEPGRVARCVPGLQLDGAATGGSDAAEGRHEGRLRVRIGGSTITYRGSLTVTPNGEGFAVEGSGTEARGSGSVRLELTVVPRRAREGEGTRLVCTGTVRGDGRLGEVEEKTATAAGRRLLDRFGTALGESVRDDPPKERDSGTAPAAEPVVTEPVEPGAESRAEPETGPPSDPVAEPIDPATQPAELATEPAEPVEQVEPFEAAEAAGSTEPAEQAEPAESGEAAGGIGEPGDNERAIPGIPGPETGEKRSASASPTDEQAAAAEAAAAEGEEPEHTGVFDTDVPPSSLEQFQAGEAEGADDEATAEAAHARRTMIGRSAEEVDHAPPRGRYAPVPVAQPLANSAALRWAAPAAAAVVAGAVVIGRALRRRG